MVKLRLSNLPKLYLVISAIFLIASAIFTVGIVLAQISPATPTNDGAESGRMLAALNTWRLEQGLFPFQSDPTLERMAYDQAAYLLTLPQIPPGGDIHNGRTGESPRERAVRSPYNWTTYGSNPAVGEIAYVGANINAATRFWRGSDIHNRTVTNALYRQIGVAALRHSLGYMYIVVMGAQPNVLPAVADPANNRLYLTNERFASNAATWLQTATQVRLFDSLGRPLQADWIPWEPVLSIPQGIGDRLFVMYSDGRRFTMTEVRLNTGLIAQTAPVTTSGGLPPTLVPTNPPPTLAPRNTQVAAIVVTPTRLPPTATAILQAATVQPTPAQSNVVTAGEPNVLLIYNARTLTLQNTSTSPLAVRELILRGGGTSFPVTFWDTQWLSGSLDALASRDCLQVWGWTEANALPQEPVCRQRRGVINVAPERMFWRTAGIEVVWRNTTLATCPATQNTCAFRIPNLNELQSGSSVSAE